MKAILWLAGTHVTAYRMENGQGSDIPERLPSAPYVVGSDLSDWFSRGWRFHTGLPSNLNGATVIVLRDGKPLDAKPDS